MALRLLLVGCGKMGAAMLARLGDHAHVAVVDPAAPPPGFAGHPHIVWHSAPEPIAPDFAPDAVILAVKPQQMPAVLPAYARYKNSLFVSIAAGLSLARLAALLGLEQAAIVRVMPNLPASIGAGMSVAIANPFVSLAQRDMAAKILAEVGAVAWIDQESLMDAVTALSGSGPAYVFALCETMAKIGVQMGLPAELAEQLARQTVIGSGALLAQSAESAETLRKAVTSPNGTTAAALKPLLAADGLAALFARAMQAAALRSQELAKQLA